MKQILYRFIYNSAVNKLARNINKLLVPVFPGIVRIPPSGIVKIKNDSGKKLLFKTNQTSHLVHSIFWESSYLNIEYADIFIKLIKKIDTFYDIGANIGFYSLLAAMENKDMKIVGFEPAAGPLFYFKENVRLNKFSNIHIEPLALSHITDGEIDFYEVKSEKYKYIQHNLSGQSNAGSNTTTRQFTHNKVKTTTLDNYVSTHAEKNIDLIKIDTEGTEYQILEHADYVLTHMQPIIICETLFNQIEDKLEKIFRSYGYEFYNHIEGKGLQKVSSISRTTDNNVRNCFFVPPGKYKLIEEFVFE